jgi:ABC-type transport system involved in cytochrome bd biosynthesis fused ATPase/permease subunit
VKPLDRRLLRYARTTRTYLAACVALGLAVAGLLIAQATLLADMISGAFLDGRTLSDLRTPIILLGAVVIGRALVAWAQEVAAYRSSAAVKAQLWSRLLEHTVRLGPGWLAEERSGELATLATQGAEALDGYFSRYLPQLVLACLVPTAVLIWVLQADLVAGVTIALTLPLIPIFMVLVGRAAQRKMDRQWGTLSVLAGHFLDVVAGLPTLKIFGRAAAQTQTINTITGDYARTTMSTSARLVPLRARARAPVSPRCGAGRGGRRPAFARRRARPVHRAAGADPDPGGLLATAPARHPLPRQRRGHRRRATDLRRP